MKIILILLLAGLSGAAQTQKGEKSIAAGPLISIPLGLETQGSAYNTGFGAEIVGQYNFSVKSALLLKTTLATWGIKNSNSRFETNRLTLFTVQGGYKYQFHPSGFSISGLVGVDVDLSDSFTSVSFTLGAGKRFFLKNDRFIDVGIDFVGADAEERVNIKALFSLFRRAER